MAQNVMFLGSLKDEKSVSKLEKDSIHVYTNVLKQWGEFKLLPVYSTLTFNHLKIRRAAAAIRLEAIAPIFIGYDFLIK